MYDKIHYKLKKKKNEKEKKIKKKKKRKALNPFMVTAAPPD